ncbi:ThiF family adenylyltransferase [Ruania halotolerans]|uniref:ThiF family adenylyltransferase n=1 Tax=Ruania halotolerans TaxID=2897773 RepID=UPI001E377E1F|nr:ThiF family adenylyltransferase [Ruania halotolerans]UFU07236.1 ThiF family adenylyltransferase [Ruania halotolerans]
MPLPPLVEPGPALSRAETDRLSRHILLPQLGELGQRRLRNATIAVIGAGGLGSPALMYLAAAGIGTLRIIDHDVVERSNLHRQIAHGVSDLGRPKVDSAAATLWELAPDLTVDKRPERLTAENADALLRGADVVLDGTDTFATRYVVDDACARLGLPVVWGSVLQFDAQVSVFWSAPPPGRDPVRLRTLFPNEPAPGSVPSCAEAGVLGALCGQVGAVMAHEAIKLIAGIGEPLLGRVLVLDALNARWTELPLRSGPDAPRPAGSPAAVARTGSAAPSARGGHLVGSGSQTGQKPALDVANDQKAAGDASAGPRFGRVSPAELDRRLTERRHRRDDFILLDVREPNEYMQRSIPGGRLIPLAQALTESGRAQIPADAEVIVYCAVGPRAEHAATDLASHGYTVSVLEGGITAWESR